MNEFEIAEIMVSYENFQVRFKGKRSWYYITPENLYKQLIIGKKIEGNIIKKKTRTWIE
jgi:hypothetical protein